MEVKHFNYYVVNSTNDIALDHLLKIHDTNTIAIVTANMQKQGRGRNNKIWFSGSDNLYYSFGLNHSTDTLPMYLMQVIGGLAVYNMLSEIVDKKNIRLKYPNDVYVRKENDTNNFKKIAGIKSEHIFVQNDICSSIVGIGINNKQIIFPEELNAISLANLNKDIKNDYLLHQLTEIILELFERKKEDVLMSWKEKLNLKNKTIKIIDNKIDEQIDRSFILDTILDDCRLSIVDEDGNKRIIDNGSSIRYDLM